MNNNFGISSKSYQLILSALKQTESVEEAILFGSRAMGNHKHGSDIDIAIKGKNIKIKDTLKLHNLLNQELPIPYFIDIVNYESIDIETLRNHIDNKGIVIYEK